MQQAFNDLQIQLDEMRLDKHNVEVTAQQDLRKLTEALQKTEQQLKLKEQELQVTVITLCCCSVLHTLHVTEIASGND